MVAGDAWLVSLRLAQSPRDVTLAALAAAGLLAVASKLFHVVLSPTWHFWLRPATSFEVFRGEWAVITGASRGLGRGYALALARRGLPVVLVSRGHAGVRPEALGEVAEQCRQYGVEARILSADAWEAGGLEDVVWNATGGEVAVLVNNVGGRPPEDPLVPKFCEFLEPEVYEAYFRMNAAPALRLTRRLLAGMVQRDRGFVLNVSSMNGLQPFPYLSFYSAAKAYVAAYSASLDCELQGRGSKVRVQAVCPGPVATDGIQRAGRCSCWIPDPVDFAERSLSLAGTAFAWSPWPWHWLQTQYLGPRSHFFSEASCAARLYAAADLSRFCDPYGGDP